MRDATCHRCRTVCGGSRYQGGSSNYPDGSPALWIDCQHPLRKALDELEQALTRDIGTRAQACLATYAASVDETAHNLGYAAGLLAGRAEGVETATQRLARVIRGLRVQAQADQASAEVVQLLDEMYSALNLQEEAKS